jgi:hypothetical protein
MYKVLYEMIVGKEVPAPRYFYLINRLIHYYYSDRLTPTQYNRLVDLLDEKLILC